LKYIQAVYNATHIVRYYMYKL